ncbi:terpene synthase 1-like isoform X2 [Citrus sinensis]|uniref:terpene synthase 1-like isoform X2 n=1 Tax=Citrus sinensis TaxID=2711 RepID=UPI0022786A5C|nr:terpene synthase 1-like isoform X2 [Citrus sinensis]
MSAQVLATVSSSTEKTVRPIAGFHPNLWGDYFLTLASDCKTNDTTHQEEYEALKQEVRSMITATADTPAQKLQLVDAVQRLGVAYHFEQEIEDAMEKIYHDDFDNIDDVDLYTVSLRFRLLRQQGFKVPCDVFEKFKDDEGKFKASLVKDVQGILSLYEAGHLAIRGEDILDEAIAFTRTHLKSMASDDVCPNNLAEQINHALDCPLRRAFPRVETRFFLSVYPRVDKHDKTLLKFAKLDFNLVQRIHQKELSAITRWWKDLDFTTKLPYARDRIVELYFWIVGTYFEPKYTLARKIMTKTIYMASIIDDTFDAYGFFEELKLFVEAVQRWDIGAMDILPEYMKVLYKALLDTFNEIEQDLAKEGRSSYLPYGKEKMQELVQMYFVQAKWFSEGYVPTWDEYYPVGLVSCGYFMLATNSFLGMCDVANKEAFEWISKDPKISTASSVICRLRNDIVSQQFEQKRGHIASGVECYIKQYGVSEEEVVTVFTEEVENAWKDMNEEFLKPTAFPVALIERPFNIARVIEFLNKKGDWYTHSHAIKDQIAAVLRDPVTI